MKLIKQFAILFSSIVISFLICYYILDNMLFLFALPNSSFILTRVIFSIVLYASINWALNGKVNKYIVHCIYVSYIAFVFLFLTILRTAVEYNTTYNFNILAIKNEPLLLILFNIIIFIPLGLYLSYLKKVQFKIALFIGFSFSILIELTQLVSSTGILDICDILLNTFGVWIGLTIYTYSINKINFLIKKGGLK